MIEAAVIILAISTTAAMLAVLGAYAQIGELKRRLDLVEHVWIAPSLEKVGDGAGLLEAEEVVK